MAEKKHRWKVWFAIFLILGILGLLFYTDAGRKTLDFFKIGRFVKPVPSVQQFSIILNTDEEAFYTQSYKIADATFIATGICQQTIKINEITVSREGVRCDLTLNGLTGSFDFTRGGSIITSGQVMSLKINDNSYSSAKAMQVVVEVIPTSFLLADLSQDKIVLSSVTGNISRLKDDGGISIVAYLDKSSLEINNFDGFLKLDNGQVILKGIAGSVKSKEFSW